VLLASLVVGVLAMASNCEEKPRAVPTQSATANAEAADTTTSPETTSRQGGAASAAPPRDAGDLSDASPSTDADAMHDAGAQPPITPDDCGVTEEKWREAAAVALAQGPGYAKFHDPVDYCRPVALEGKRVPYLFYLHADTQASWILVLDGKLVPADEKGAYRKWLRTVGDLDELGPWGALAMLVYLDILEGRWRLRTPYPRRPGSIPRPRLRSDYPWKHTEQWLRRKYGVYNEKLEVLEWRAGKRRATMTLYRYSGGGGSAGGQPPDLPGLPSSGGMGGGAILPSKYEAVVRFRPGGITVKTREVD
jgi:hypothetical protein